MNKYTDDTVPNSEEIIENFHRYPKLLDVGPKVGLYITCEVPGCGCLSRLIDVQTIGGDTHIQSETLLGLPTYPKLRFWSTRTEIKVVGIQGIDTLNPMIEHMSNLT